MSPGAFLA
jgi:transposase